ncbi:sensor histidine kinase [Rhodovulum sp. BSW8]|uniref:histidine kinase n=1 Tax=Rhodovulum visakhapatnamense TaxID=364297 RepID=A0A4R8FWA6_9RHOB|nr:MULTISPECIES: HAMP domain-containing sensor histidine kinase [Rhodovulum]OLS43789.1 sensor histidine kinase [Rhodovulum sulfidophilum]MBL3570303.1 HAMP domain-containing histidine kinase [Rhodovulum visakhapatnamense]MBL3578945.1 HAMP domain-containing histidine kinase [Rhodovulum visakhapatnamense]RBO52978.1 sensor histidine kinase [Rhodovulum sp. BSW8]TDX31173.1 signal transduction histidine kinase [Rhodovulum visakhapatnamense]
MFLNSLSGRFLLLTIVFVMLAEVLIFVPSVARFRVDFLLARLERSQIASLALLASDGMIGDELERELLQNAGVYNIVLRRDQARELVLSSPIPEPVYRSFDLREAGVFDLIPDALIRLVDPKTRVIRVIGQPVQRAGLLIEVTMSTAELRKAMIDYGLRILVLSAVISVLSALLLFLAARRLLVVPIRRVVRAMLVYAEAPEDNRRIIVPSARVRELNEAETALRALQEELTGALRQKDRLAQLGAAVAKISHDLRNILTTAQLFADRMELSDDPAVKRAAPKIVGAISRAVHLCEATLAFGRAQEPPPRLERLALAPIVNEVVDGERLAAGDYDISFSEDVPAGLTLRADVEQLLRVLTNLVRNARQAIVASGKPGEIGIRAEETEEDWIIKVTDTGPGLPPKAREHLFQPFHGGTRKDGTGLGLAIAMELVRGHGGALELRRSDASGTAFEIRLPKAAAALPGEGDLPG